MGDSPESFGIFFWKAAATHSTDDGADRRGKNEEADVKKKRKRRRRKTKSKDKSEAATQTTSDLDATVPVTLIEAHPHSPNAAVNDNEKKVLESTPMSIVSGAAEEGCMARCL